MLWSGNGQICCFFFPSLNWLTNLNIEPRLEAKIWTRTILKWHCLRFALLSVVSVRTEEFLSQSVTTLRLGLRHPPCEESPISSAVGPLLHCGKMKKGIYGMSAQGQECVHVFITCVCVCVLPCAHIGGNAPDIVAWFELQICLFYMKGILQLKFGLGYFLNTPSDLPPTGYPCSHRLDMMW